MRNHGVSIGYLIVDLAEIELFGTLMRVGTTIETARVLGLSQPAISDRLKRLESRLGFLLFQRRGNWPCRRGPIWPRRRSAMWRWWR